MSGSVYEVLQEGNWKFRVIKAASVTPIGFGEVGYEVALVTYSKNIAEICCSALNASVEKPNAPQHGQPKICRRCKGQGFYYPKGYDQMAICQACHGDGKLQA